MKFTTYLHIEPRLRTGGALPNLPPICLNGVYGDNFTVARLGCHCSWGGGEVTLYRLFPDDRHCCHLDSAFMGCDAVLIGKVTVEGDDGVFLRNVGIM